MQSIEKRVIVTILRCNSLVNPLGTGSLQPLLRWQLSSDAQCVMQSAFQIEVRSGDSIIWDTGKLESDVSVHVPYEGSSLKSRMHYHWRVRIWDERDDVSNWSEMAWWEMGLFEAGNWQAHWIEPLQQPTEAEAPIYMFKNLSTLSPLNIN